MQLALCLTGFPRSRVLAVAVVSLGVLVAPAAGEIIPIDPFATPAVKLPPDEAARLQTLLSAAFPPLLSDPSPDDRTILTATPDAGVAFLDLRTKATVPVSPEVYAFTPLTEFRWRNRGTLAFVGFDPIGDPVLVSVSRDDGSATAEPVALTGFPVSLSRNAGRLLVARTVEAARLAPGAPGSSRGPLVSPFDVERPHGTFKRPGPAIFDMEMRSVRVATIAVELAVLEIATGEDRPLLQMAPETALLDAEWSLDDGHLALVRWLFPDNTRGGGVPTESDSVQDGLGRLRPSRNPFFTSSRLDLFSLDERKLRRVELEPCLPNGEIFLDSVWSHDARTLMVQMQDPGTPRGRRYPTYGNPNRSQFRFYSSQGHLRDTLDRPEVESPFDLLRFLSNHEVVIAAPFELSFGLYYYNLKSREFRRLPTPEGSIYQVRATRDSRELVYNFGSFQDPYEIYKIHVKDHGPKPLTHVNDAVAAANRLRFDKVRFHLKGGDREGFLLQPKGARFPPRNVPIVVWQQGGPTSTMTQDWGGFVEQPFNVLPNFGFALLMVPLQGRIGFGPRLLDQLADERNFGQVDIDEQAEIARHLVDRGYTSRPRLGITGCSYGGYFTSQSITRHPDAYAAANTQCSLLDLFHEFELGYRPYISYLMGRTPDEDPAEYTRDSPVRNAAKVKTPTLIFDGTEDFLPYTFSTELHDGIAATGTPVDFYLFQGEGHGLAFPNSQFVAGQAQIEWFRRFLGHD